MTTGSRSSKTSTATSSSSDQAPQEQDREQLAALRAEEARLDAELRQLESDPKETYIQSLHEYNEIKDAAQAVMGVLAVHEGVTVTKLHEKYLPPNMKTE